MKKLVVSKALKEKIPQKLLKEIYRLITVLPTSGMEHRFSVFPNEMGISLTHMIPSTNFTYSLFFSENFKINDIFQIIAYDTGEKIMMILSSEVK